MDAERSFGGVKTFLNWDRSTTGSFFPGPIFNLIWNRTSSNVISQRRLSGDGIGGRFFFFLQSVSERAVSDCSGGGRLALSEKFEELVPMDKDCPANQAE